MHTLHTFHSRNQTISRLFTGAIFAAAVTVSALFFASDARVEGGWVAPPQNPPANNVPQPLNIGLVTQLKPGDLGVKNLFISDTQTWATKFWQFAPITNPVGANLFPSVVQPSANIPAATNMYATWQPRVLPLNVEDPPVGVQRKIKALAIHTVCSDVYMWLTGESALPPVPGIADAFAGNWRLACAATRNITGGIPSNPPNDTYDTNTVVLPVTQNPTASNSVTIYAHFTDPWSATIPSAPNGGQFLVQRARVIGYYYTDEPAIEP